LRAEASEIPAILTRYEDLVADPARAMGRICEYLGICFEPEVVLTPTKAGNLWQGNSATARDFTKISSDRARSWERELTPEEIGWVEWHCRELMPHFGYEPRSVRWRFTSNWVKPIRQERPKQYLKSRYYSIRDKLLGPRNK